MRVLRPLQPSPLARRPFVFVRIAKQEEGRATVARTRERTLPTPSEYYTWTATRQFHEKLDGIEAIGTFAC